MHQRGIGHDVSRRKFRRVEAARDPLDDFRPVLARHDAPVADRFHRIRLGDVETGQLRDSFEFFAARRAFQRADCLHEFDHGILAVADHEEIEERRQRFRVEHRRPARKQQRRIVRAVLAPQRQPGKVNRVQDVRVSQFRLQREPDQVRGGQRVLRLVHKQRQAARAQRRLHVRRGRIAPLAPDMVQAVQNRIQDVQSEIAQSQLIQVREEQAHPQVHVRGPLMHRVPLRAQIPRRLLDPGQNFVYQCRTKAHCVPSSRPIIQNTRRCCEIREQGAEARGQSRLSPKHEKTDCTGPGHQTVSRLAALVLRSRVTSVTALCRAVTVTNEGIGCVLPRTRSSGQYATRCRSHGAKPSWTSSLRVLTRPRCATVDELSRPSFLESGLVPLSCSHTFAVRRAWWGADRPSGCFYETSRRR